MKRIIATLMMVVACAAAWAIGSPSLKGPVITSAVGPTGPTGATGATGATGPAGTGNVNKCTLNGGTPSTCTATVAAGSFCRCTIVGDTAVLAALGCAVTLSSTTLTITSGVGATNDVNYQCTAAN